MNSPHLNIVTSNGTLTPAHTLNREIAIGSISIVYATYKNQSMGHE